MSLQFGYLPPEEEDPPQLRPARQEEAHALADLFHRTRLRDMPYLPALYTQEEIRRWMAEIVLPGCEVWVAEVGGALAGFMALKGDQLEHLYVDPSHQGRGIGARLLDEAKRLRPQGLTLWVFQENAGARRFYAAHGFVEAELTDGAGNEEGAPDVRCVWRPAPAQDGA